jgi:hypothetical protein
MSADDRREGDAGARTEAAAPLHARLDLGLFPRRRAPLILQGEAAECGLACLAMIAGHHGQRISLPALRRRFAISLKGTTLAALMDIAQALGLTSRPLRVELDALRQVRTPAVLHWDLAHYVVLVKAGPRTVHVIDPAVGHRRLAWAEVSRHFTGVVLEVVPAVGFQRRRAAERVRLSDLWSGASGFAGSFGQLVVLSLVLQAAARGARAFKLFGREIDRHAVWQIANVEAVNAGLRLSRAGLVGGWRGGSNCGAWRTGTRRTSPGWCVMSI